jgi:hypothetical protein
MNGKFIYLLPFLLHQRNLALNFKDFYPLTNCNDVELLIFRVNKRDNCEDEEFRIHLKGNEKVGKTNLIKHWKNEEYKEYIPTESFSLRYLCIENNEKHYKLKVVWFIFFQLISMTIRET